MVGEERVRRLLFRVKQENEGGQLEMDESCKLCLGEDVVVPEGQRCTASREAIMHLFGGTTQETYPHVKKDVQFARIKKGDDLICANFSFNPDMPKQPGEHGIMMSEMNWFKKGDHCATFVGVDVHEWLYVGDYIVFGQADLPVAVWNGLAEGVKKTWAKNIIVKGWGKSWLNRCKLPAAEQTEAGVMAAFASGRLIMSISILQCIGYDPAIVAAVGEAQKGWLNGTVGSAKLHAKGAARKWLLTPPGERWRNETRAGREWSQQDALGRRYASLRTRDEKKQWAAERMSRQWRNAYLGIAGAPKKRKVAAATRKSKARPAKRRRVQTKSGVSDSDEDDEDDDRQAESSRAAVTRSTRNRRTTKTAVVADSEESGSEYEEPEEEHTPHQWPLRFGTVCTVGRQSPKGHWPNKHLLMPTFDSV
ncbi:hypothetical protein EXIGLDRAFT_117984 [Exidia glandulosa HHB12029]|uniref:DUF6697 domain-containing protein n=1 Tax=Exidia glandulosa HHB12029 TaxID=1314781 RepID=A0A165GI65_EXIGL|nr:hypothetical protein EXIGLDRAFT_117984 [Exidia glandulosa HHB12029]